MLQDLSTILDAQRIETSAPCRIDLGGTLDIRTFYYPLRHLAPCTFNIALDMRTTARLLPFEAGMIKISSEGFESEVFALKNAPFDHPLGLMFAVAVYFGAHGVHIDIASASPPKGALGGSSAAAVALIGAFSKVRQLLGGEGFSRKQIALLAHGIEESAAGIPCGMQDQLAAAYGGVNVWQWPTAVDQAPFEKRTLLNEEGCRRLQPHLLVAYCGVGHVSRDINSRWIRQFIAGEHRGVWITLAENTHRFVDGLKSWDFNTICESMNRETDLRRQMTPEVVDALGADLVESAAQSGCGAKVAGAGAGGCIWALGAVENIRKLTDQWTAICARRKDARILDAPIAAKGLSGHE